MADQEQLQKQRQIDQFLRDTVANQLYGMLKPAMIKSFMDSFGGPGKEEYLKQIQDQRPEEFIKAAQAWAERDPSLFSKYGLSADKVRKMLSLYSDSGARKDYLTQFDPTGYASSKDWLNSVSQDLGFGVAAGNSDALDKAGIFQPAGLTKDQQRVQDYENKMKEFIAELQKPLDRNDPQVQNLIRTANVGQLRRQQEMGLGAGGYSAANSERAALSAVTPYQQQRYSQAIGLTGDLYNSANQREQFGQSLDYQYNQLDQQKQLAQQQMDMAEKQAGYSSGQGNARALGAGIGGGTGTAIGAGLGALLAPFTGGASIALGASLGGAAGSALGGGIGGASYGPYKPGLGGYSSYSRGRGGFYGGSGT